MQVEEQELLWLELFGGPADGLRVKRENYPVTLNVPDDFDATSDLREVAPCTYRRTRKVKHTWYPNGQQHRGRSLEVMLYCWTPEGEVKEPKNTTRAIEKASDYR